MTYVWTRCTVSVLFLCEIEPAIVPAVTARALVVDVGPHFVNVAKDVDVMQSGLDRHVLEEAVVHRNHGPCVHLDDDGAAGHPDGVGELGSVRADCQRTQPKLGGLLGRVETVKDKVMHGHPRP
eukprot:CAMPEP_0182949268 /NCGR_PEP_ID=MMETSP0105_2-20130417/60176_1 /TAXON_ID=81532 ORGANISM="Acanthoeca-like sp., Strain 10tr" /NCGR_SAMPLE_ID=MMETSP0105_2 /ASSEMBLY_ACC=CAM_ASM_000205 /LENGTH=123 /DNA_ID=CAMNT_0025089565 /DNA_START=56 /DNA_END=427 /DNA_ORIENTATION=+